jgi:hypothetical protein
MSTYEGEHTIFGLLSQANLTQNDVLQFHPFTRAFTFPSLFPRACSRGIKAIVNTYRSGMEREQRPPYSLLEDRYSQTVALSVRRDWKFYL